jgi:hypothetical protein
MTNMTHSPARPSKTLLAAIALAFAAFFAPGARADIAPSCDSEMSLITCNATDVGKPCQGGGKCFEISCSSSAGASSKVYKCDACPTIIDTPAGTCGISNMGASCGDGDGGTGTCGAIRYYCTTATSGKYPCHKPATETPTGPPSGAAGSGTGGGAGTSGAAGTSGGAGTGGGAAGTSGAAGTGGGTAGTSGGSGCDVAPRATPSAIGVGLVVLGFIFVVIERIRRRSRR